MLDLGDPSFIPILRRVLATGAADYGPLGGSEWEAAIGLMQIGTRDAMVGLRDGLAEAESLQTYAPTRSGVTFDVTAQLRTRRIPDMTGRTLEEWLELLQPPPFVVAESSPTPQVWNLAWRRDVPTSRAQVSFELGNIEGARDPRTLVLDSIRLNGAMPALELRPHSQGNARWRGPWVDIVFRQRDVIELVPLEAREGDSFTAVVTGVLTDGTHIKAEATVRLVGQL